MHTATVESRRRTALILGIFTALATVVPPKLGAQSVWDKMKQATLRQACRGGDQNACQALTKLGSKQPQQPQQQSGQPQPRSAQSSSGQQPPRQGTQQAAQAHDNGGPFKPPTGTKIEETVLAPVQDRAKFEVSPHGVHVATVETDGSRAVVWYDGVEGPKFDEILAQNTFSDVVFSPDGNRYAYCARSGNQYVVVVDGKELVRSSESQNGRFNCQLGFTSNSKHVFYYIVATAANSRNFTRFVFDGKPEPANGEMLPSPTADFRSFVFSPDGDHYAYVWSDPQRQKPSMLIIDGKPAPYQGGSPQWTNDSKHLYTQRSGGGFTELLYDGKPIARAFSFKVYMAPVGDMVVTAVTGGTNAHPFSFLVVNGKKVPGSDTVERGMIHDVVFSPDGKHYAAHCEDLNNHHYLILDGKRGQDYTSITKLSFTADSSAVVYEAMVNGRYFVVVGDHESSSASGGTWAELVIAPAGNRVGALAVENGRPMLLMDGKVTPLNGRGVSNLSFTPDGAHYFYLLNESGSDFHVAIDGVPQAGASVSKDRANTQDASARYLISPDGKHFAHFATSESASGSARGVLVDGKFIATGFEGNNMQLAFSPDSKHLLWVHQYPSRNSLRLFMDGQPLADFTPPVALASMPNWWDFDAGGALSLLSRDDSSLKRITITLSSETNVDAWLGSNSAAAMQARQ